LPPGCRQIPEEERVETLEQLVSTRKELNSLLDSMPISMRTESLRIKKQEIEEKLRTVDDAIVKFSRKVVYVKE
jgi:hypothetical protein